MCSISLSIPDHPKILREHNTFYKFLRLTITHQLTNIKLMSHLKSGLFYFISILAWVVLDKGLGNHCKIMEATSEYSTLAEEVY